MHTERLVAILITVGLIILRGGCQTGEQPTYPKKCQKCLQTA